MSDRRIECRAKEHARGKKQLGCLGHVVALRRTAVGAFTMKTFAAGFLRRFGFRNVLIYVGLIASALTAACATFTPSTPFAFISAT